MKTTHKPVRSCHGCLLNLGDHCWVHEDPRGQWQRYRECPGLTDEALHAEFRAWKGEPTIAESAAKPLKGSRKHPRTYRARAPRDRIRLVAEEAEDTARRRPERAVLAQIACGCAARREAEDSLAELGRLAATAGARVIGTFSRNRSSPDPARYAGPGQLGALQVLCREHDANLVIFDNDLTPSQVNNLDRALGIKVIDRTELILQIFARRAHSEEAQAQVELAQLEYMRTRLPSERQARFRGGIGMRGPGESPLAVRMGTLSKRLNLLKARLEQIRARRERTRLHRDLPSICLVGYTNAGKSTLLNALAATRTYVDDKLFATLDTKTGRIRLADGRDALLSDTVGFIRNLPHKLVASFRSTLEEASRADALLIVADASDPFADGHLRIVGDTLREINAAGIPAVTVLNKCDRPEAAELLPELRARHPEALCLSALRRDGIDALRVALARVIPEVQPARL